MENLIAKRFRQIPIIEQKPDYEIAQIIGVSPQMYVAYKNGTSSPSANILKTVIEKFKYNAGWFFDASIK